MLAGCPSVKAVRPQSGPVTEKYGNENTKTTVYGTGRTTSRSQHALSSVRSSRNDIKRRLKGSARAEVREALFGGGPVGRPSA